MTSTKTSRFAIVLPAILALIVYSIAVAADPPESITNEDSSIPIPRAWDHMAVSYGETRVQGSTNLGSKIDRLGDKGWELVDVSTVVRDGTTIQTIYYFKRPKWGRFSHR